MDGISKSFEKSFSSLLANEFYFCILIHANEYDPIKFRYVVLYTFFNGKERILSETDLGKLLGCEHYFGPHEAFDHYLSDNVWDTLARQAWSKKIASNLKSLPHKFLHHFIASTVQCRTGSFSKVTTDDIWLLEMAFKGIKINLARFIMNKMILVLKERKKKPKENKSPHSNLKS